MPATEPAAYLVTTVDGYRAVFLDRARAEQYAEHTHGTVQPLFLGPA